MKRIHYIFFAIALLFSCQKPISDFQSQNFIKFFGSGYESKGNDVIELADGGYVITGYDRIHGADYQLYIAKVDVNGNLIWSKTYGRNNCKEEGKIVKEVSDGFLIAGTSIQNGSNITNSFILKVGFSGDSIEYNEIGSPAYNVIINDMLISGNYVFVVGQSNEKSLSVTQSYIAQCNLSGSLEIDQSYKNSESTNRFFKKVFNYSDSLLSVGISGQNLISIDFIAPNFPLKDSKTPFSSIETPADALFEGDTIYLLSNISSSGTKLAKLYPFPEMKMDTAVWQTDPISSIVGKSVAYREDGTLIICGENTIGDNTEINFIKVKKNGNAEYGQQFFRTFSGTVERVISTKDNGLIVIGSTNPTYGTNIQLIKTDKDLFLLKP